MTPTNSNQHFGAVGGRISKQKLLATVLEIEIRCPIISKLRILGPNHFLNFGPNLNPGPTYNYEFFLN